MGKGEGAKSTGYRAGTRDLFTKKFRSNGYNALITTFMRNYKVGDVVDVVCDSRQQKGMPHKYYHGRTGRIWNVTRRAVGVEINKVHRQRQIVKRIHVRMEHLRPSKSAAGHTARIKPGSSSYAFVVVIVIVRVVERRRGHPKDRGVHDQCRGVHYE